MSTIQGFSYNYPKLSQFLIGINTGFFLFRMIGILIFELDPMFYIPWVLGMFRHTGPWMPFYLVVLFSAFGAILAWVMNQRGQVSNVYYEYAVLGSLILFSLNLFFNVP